MALLRHNNSNTTLRHSEKLPNGFPEAKPTVKQLYSSQHNSRYLPKFQVQTYDLKYALVRETTIVTH